MSMIDERGPQQLDERESALPGHILAVVLPLVTGVVVAVTWRLLIPLTESFGDSQELEAAVDGTLAGLGLLVGLGAGAVTLLRPSGQPVRRVGLVMLACLGGAAVAWLLGDQLGTPGLRAVGAALVWPTTTSVTIMVGSILPWTSRRLEPPTRPARSEPSGLG